MLTNIRFIEFYNPETFFHKHCTFSFLTVNTIFLHEKTQLLPPKYSCHIHALSQQYSATVFWEKQNHTHRYI